MLKPFNLAALTLFSALAAGQVYAEETPVAVVNGVSIPQARMEMGVKSAAMQGRQDSPQLREAVREELISIELMSQEAVKNGLDKQAETMNQLELARQSALAGAYVQDYLKNHPISEDALKQEYESMKLAAASKEYKASHILVKDEEKAKSIAAQLKKGAKFDKLASKHSLDPGSKEKGGELGWNRPGAFVKPFDDAMMNLKKGETSAPVQSNFGWHIIKLDDVRDFSFPELQAVKQELTQRMQQQSLMKNIEELRQSAKIE